LNSDFSAASFVLESRSGYARSRPYRPADSAVAWSRADPPTRPKFFGTLFARQLEVVGESQRANGLIVRVTYDENLAGNFVQRLCDRAQSVVVARIHLRAA
jgi:hypothetical protein